jgi:hypothetical protein
MAWIRNNLIAILLITVCVAGVFLYKSYFSQGTAALVTSSDVDSMSNEMLQALSRLKSISFDPELFNDSTFVSLVDFGTQIQPQPVGRPNPFAPIGGRPLITTQVSPATPAAPITPARPR